VVLDKGGAIIMATKPAADVLGEGLDHPFPASLLEFIASARTDSLPDRVEFLNRHPLEERERLLRILEAIDHPIMNKEGELLGLILKGT